MTVYQENSSDIDSDTPLTVTHTGTWSVSRCACFNGGTTLFSRAAGASRTYTIPVTRPGQLVALVVPKNTNRGTIKVSVDGGSAVAVNTHSSTSVNRVIMWQKALSVGTHKLKLTNAGTAGHSRVDIDSILLSRAQ